MAIWISGIEYIDRFMSDESVTVLEILEYLDSVGSYDSRNKIVYAGVNDTDLSRIRRFRVDTDDIIKSIRDFLLKIDQYIFNMVIQEFIYEEEKKYMGFKYETYAKYYIWEEKNVKKTRDDNYISILVDGSVWNRFVKIRKKRGIKIDDLFKIAIIRFLERRLDMAMKEMNGLCQENVF